MATDSERIPWHQLFEGTVKEVLQPVGIEVITEFELSPSPPIGDILILQTGEKGWTKPQLERLPDGIRQSRAQRNLIEFKYKESLNLAVLQQAVMSNTLYCRSKKLTNKKVAFFVILSRQPRRKALQYFGYEPTEIAGLYKSKQPILSDITLISLNKLPPTQYNAFIKCFASQEEQKRVAFEQVRRASFVQASQDLSWLFAGLLSHLLANEGEMMETETITLEKVKKMGQLLSDAWLESLPPQKRLAGLAPKDILAVLPPAELLASFAPAERVAGLAPAERVAGLAPAERVAGLPLAQRLAGFSLEEIEAYLAQLKNREDLPYIEG